MISASSSDQELLEAIQGSQNETAFEIIIRRHEDKVFGLCFRMLNSRQEAEDITQETFIRLWDNPDDWKPKARFSTWLFRVATNRCLNRLRFLKLKSFLSFTTECDEITASKEGSPESKLISAERTKLFQRQFRKLPARQKAALHLRYWENLSVKEVASAMSTTVKSAESLIYRGKKTLSKLSF